MAAIYQWFLADEVVYTTTLYPIDVTEALQLSVATNPYANLSEFPIDYSTFKQEVVGISLDVLLLSADSSVDYTSFSQEIVSIELVSLLLSTESDIDYTFFSQEIVSVELVEMLVTCDTPDESLQLACSTNSSNSSLTVV